MGGFNTFLFNLANFNGIFSSLITRSGGSLIEDRISIKGETFILGTSPSLPNGFNGTAFNQEFFNGASLTGSSGENIVTTNNNEIMRISIAKG